MTSDHDLIPVLLAAQSKGDWDAMFAVMHEDGVFELPFLKQRFEGRVEIERRMAPSIDRMIGLTFSDIEVRDMAEPGWMIAHFKGNATVRPTGRPYRQTYVGIFRAIDGKIVLFQEYFDTLELAIACARVGPVS